MHFGCITGVDVYIGIKYRAWLQKEVVDKITGKGIAHYGFEQGSSIIIVEIG
jgi:hypothetical protein